MKIKMIVFRALLSGIFCLSVLTCLSGQNYKVLKTKGAVYYNSQVVVAGMRIDNPMLFSFPDCRGAVLLADRSSENYIVMPEPYEGSSCKPVIEPYPYPIRTFKMWEKKMLEKAEPQLLYPKSSF